MSDAGGDRLRPVDKEARSEGDEHDTTNACGECRRPVDTEAPSAEDEHGTRHACGDCLRRSWLLAVLSTRLAYQARDRGRLLELLALGDEELVQAIGGRRRAQLRERHARFTPEDIRWSTGVEAVCRHDRGYPRALEGDWAPQMLYMAGTAQRLRELIGEQPAVAIVGSRRATDYGMEMARSLARGLSASGVTVTAGLSDGIAVAAQAGALEVKGKTLTVVDGGLDVACPARRRALYERVLRTGCAVAELPCGCGVRQWCYTARERIVVGLAQLTIVVEADESPGELLGARIAKALGRTVAAVPGRVTSPVSRGTNALLMEGAELVRGPEDALELLYSGDTAGSENRTSSGDRTSSENTTRNDDMMRNRDAPRRIAGTPGSMAATPRRPTGPPRAAQLEQRLRTTLEQVGAGRDTPAKLTAASEDAGEVLLALSELELMGLLTRGDGGRYVPRESLAGR